MFFRVHRHQRAGRCRRTCTDSNKSFGRVLSRMRGGLAVRALAAPQRNAESDWHEHVRAHWHAFAASSDGTWRQHMLQPQLFGRHYAWPPQPHWQPFALNWCLLSDTRSPERPYEVAGSVSPPELVAKLSLPFAARNFVPVLGSRNEPNLIVYVEDGSPGYRPAGRVPIATCDPKPQNRSAEREELPVVEDDGEVCAHRA